MPADSQLINELQQRLSQCERINSILVKSLQTLTDSYNALYSELECFENNCQYELLDPRNSTSNSDIFFPNIKSCDETLNEIIINRKSLCCFGDGEFSCISGNLRAKFTSKFIPELSKRLVEVLHSDDEQILIAIADNYGNLNQYSYSSTREMRHYMTPSIRAEYAMLLQRDKTYYNGYITRPYVLYRDNSSNAPFKRFQTLKQIWDKKDCIIIESSQSRLGVGNDLFSNSKSLKRILPPLLILSSI